MQPTDEVIGGIQEGMRSLRPQYWPGKILPGQAYRGASWRLKK